MPRNVPIEDRLENHERELWENMRRITALEKSFEAANEAIRVLSNRVRRLEAIDKRRGTPSWDSQPDATAVLRESAGR
jgi:hypothetical protein